MGAKLTKNMNTMDIVMTMCEGNPGALNVLMQMMNDPRGFMDILLCDSLDIRGSKLYMLHNDCCKRNNDKFYRTLMMLRNGVYSAEQIKSNFDLVYAIPFIDDSIVIEGVPPYGENFGPANEKWEEFSAKNKEIFTQKLNEALEEQKRRSSGGTKL